MNKLFSLVGVVLLAPLTAALAAAMTMALVLG